MQNPFRDDGPLDWATSFGSLAVSVLLLVNGISDYRNGSSFGWPLTGGALVLLAIRGIYRQVIRHRRRARAVAGPSEADQR